MPKLMREQLFVMISRLVIFVFVFLAYTCLFFANPVAADGAKQIKAHPHAQKESLPGIVDLKAKAEEYNTQAIELFEDGRYAEAQELWEKAIDLMEHPLSARFDFEATAEEQQPFESSESSPADESPEVASMTAKYQSGLSWLEQKEYGEAQKVFQEIDLAQPGYRNTKKYLVVIDELLREEDSSATQEMMSDARESGSADADSKFDHQEEEAQWEEATKRAEQKLQERITEKVELVYQRALRQYKNKQYVEARHSFEEVQVLSPDYQLTAKYLEGIDDDIFYAQQEQEKTQGLVEEQERRQDELEFRKTVAAKEEIYRKGLFGKVEENYRQAIANFKNREFEEAEDNFRKVDAMAAGYKLTGKYSERIQQLRDDEARSQAEEESRWQALMEHNAEEDMKRTIEESERLRQQELREVVEAAYQEARMYYGQGELEKARADFSEVERILPGYRSTRKYLAFIEKDRTRGQEITSDIKPVALSPEETEKAAGSASRKQAEAEQYYQQAKELYKKRKFDRAKEFFQKVDALIKDYQATDKFLARIDKDIEQEQKYQQMLAQRDAQRQTREKAFEQKRTAVKEAKAQRRQEARRLKKTATRIKSDRDKMINHKVLELYREAESDYKNHLYALAGERFSAVQRISPGYKATEEYLERIAHEYQGETVGANVPPQSVPTESLPVPLTEENTLDEKFVMPEIQKQQQAFARAVRREKLVQGHARPTVVDQPAIEMPKSEPTNVVAASTEAGAMEGPVKIDDPLAVKAEELFQGAVRLYVSKEFVPARDKFLDLEQLRPGYKTTSKYLGWIDRALTKEQKKAERIKQKQDKEAADRIAKENAAKQKQEARNARLEAKEKAARELAEKNKLKMQRAEEKKRGRLMVQAAKKYAQALAAYGKKDFIAARRKFGEVEALYPDFKETTQYLNRVDADIAAANQKSKEVIAAPIYVRPKGDTAAEQVRLKADELFSEAVKLYKSRQFVLALEKFQEVEKYAPNYKTTLKYIELADRAVLGQHQKEELAKQKQDARDARIAAKEEATARKLAERTERVRQKEETARIKRQEREQAVKQRQDARSAQFEADAQKAQERTEKIHRQAQIKSTPVNVPALQPAWVKPPNFDAVDLSHNTETLRVHYAQIQRERKNVQTALDLRVNDLYSRAVELYDQGYYAGAKNLFEEIAEAKPAFKKTKNYLDKIDQKFERLPIASAMPESGIMAPSVYVKPRVQVVADALDILETSQR